MRSLADVIDFLAACRDSHIDQKKNTMFHEQCIVDYDSALKVLRKIRALI